MKNVPQYLLISMTFLCEWLDWFPANIVLLKWEICLIYVFSFLRLLQKCNMNCWLFFSQEKIFWRRLNFIFLKNNYFEQNYINSKWKYLFIYFFFTNTLIQISPFIKLVSKITMNLNSFRSVPERIRIYYKLTKAFENNNC